MLLEMRPPLAPEVVVQMLNAFAPAFCAQYLETAMDEGIAKEEDFQTELAMIYLRLALDGDKEKSDTGECSFLTSTNRILLITCHFCGLRMQASLAVNAR